MEPAKLFLIDDQLLMRQAFARALSVTDKYEVVGHCGDTNEVPFNPATFNADVIILDTVFPKQQQVEMLLALREQGINAPVLVLTGDAQWGEFEASISAGARGFVPKQSDLGEMEFAIDTILQGSTYVSPKFKEQDASPTGSKAILSTREHEIFLLLAQGKKNKEIGKMLSISTRTVDTHRSNILKKLQMKSNAELVKLAISEGFI